MANTTVFTKSLGAASATSIAASQAASAGTPLTLTTATGVTIDTATASNTAIGRRVLITSTSGSETASVTITGTNASGSIISETDTFSGSSTTLQSTFDYVTVTSVVPSGTIAGSLSAGTNGVGSSPWQTMNWQGFSPMNISVAVELVSGSAGYTVEYTFDDPNKLLAGATYPLNLSDLSPTALVAASATKDGLFNFPLVALRLTVNSGTGVLRTRIVQAGIG